MNQNQKAFWFLLFIFRVYSEVPFLVGEGKQSEQRGKVWLGAKYQK